MGAGAAVVAEGAYPPTEAAMRAILTTAGLTKGCGAVQAVRGVDVRFKTGCRHAIIGPNGAGKTTLLNLLAGALAPQQGQVFYRGQDITTWDQGQRVRQGGVRRFQQSRLFAGLTGLESVMRVRGVRQGTLALWRAGGAVSRRSAGAQERVV